MNSLHNRKTLKRRLYGLNMDNLGYTLLACLLSVSNITPIFNEAHLILCLIYFFLTVLQIKASS